MSNQQPATNKKIRKSCGFFYSDKKYGYSNFFISSTSSVFVIKQEGNNFSLTIHHVFGNQEDTIVIKMLSNGKTRKVLSVLDGKLERRKDGLHITLWKKDFLDKVTYKFGKDKNEFIADEVLVSDSDNHHNIWIFDRDVSK